MGPEGIPRWALGSGEEEVPQLLRRQIWAGHQEIGPLPYRKTNLEREHLAVSLQECGLGGGPVLHAQVPTEAGVGWDRVARRFALCRGHIGFIFTLSLFQSVCFVCRSRQMLFP